MTKPRLHKSNGGWRCFVRTICGLRITGYGETGAEAYADWKQAMREVVF